MDFPPSGCGSGCRHGDEYPLTHSLSRRSVGDPAQSGGERAFALLDVLGLSDFAATSGPFPSSSIFTTWGSPSDSPTA
jgi:hypothetical protein